MALRVKVTGSLAAARARLLSASTPEEWLLTLRWVALAGMLATTLVARALVPSLDPRGVHAALALVALVNVGWWAALRHGWLLPGGSVAYQLAGDLCLLALVLWHSGGLDNPFACFLTFQIVLSGLLGSPRTTIGVVALALGLTTVLALARPLPMAGARLDPLVLRTIASALALSALGAFAGVSVVIFARRLEELRQETARGERLAGLGRIVATLCHELNTPLGTILIAGKDVEHIAQGAKDPDLGELARTITTQAARTSELIGLLRGQVSPGAEREEFDVSGFVPAHVASTLDHLRYAGARAVEVPTGLKAAVYPSALQHILTNVLRNAVDAMADTAEPRLEVRARREGGGVAIAVRDNGTGVDPRVVAHLGEPFQTTKAQRGGSGLGLYASATLAEQMGGTLQLESRPGQGTLVTLTLKEAERSHDVDDLDGAVGG